MIALLLTTLLAHAQSYEVPVSDDLKEYAQYPTHDLKIEDNRISYSLPLELTGIKNQIVLEKVAEGAFRGPKGRASCDAEKCKIKYKHLEIDPALVRAKLRADGFTGEDLDKRIEVARVFSGDPAGIVHFTK